MKFPRTPHITGSKATDDDIFVRFSPDFLASTQFVATEKMDGSNITIDRNGAYASNGGTPSADWFYPARDTYHRIGHLIDDGITIAGELLTWRKCIPYDSLPGEFMVFSVIDGETVLPWNDVVEYAQLLELPVVNVLAQGSYEDVIATSMRKLNTRERVMEGFVMRNQDAFSIGDYADNVAKFVGDWHSPVAGNTGRNSIVTSGVDKYV